MNCIELFTVDWETTNMTNFLKDESGATAIEYGLIAALVGVVIISGLSQLAGGLNGLFGSITGSLGGASGGEGGE
jgi:pilus assembly protein Flp/PilA